MKLKELQKLFYNALDSSQLNWEELEKSCVAGKASVNDRLAVYQNGYLYKLKETLSLNFPKLETIMGDDSFELLASAYEEAHPPKNDSLFSYGKNLPQFLKTTTNELIASVSPQELSSYTPEQQRAFLNELADFEKLMTESYYNSYDGLKVYERTHLEKVKVLEDPMTDKKQYEILPGIQLFAATWPITQIYKTLQFAAPKKTFGLIYTVQEQVYFEDLQDEVEFLVFSSLQKYHSLELAVEKLSESEVFEDILTCLQERLPLWVQKGWILSHVS